MYELWRNIFYALLAELFIVLISLLAKENKRRQVLILAVGTTIVGIFGFCPSLPPPIATKTPVFYTATAVNTSVTHVPAVTNTFISSQKAAKLLYTDDFNSNSLDNWNVVTGSLQIKNGTYGGKSTCGGKNNIAVTGASDWKNIIIDFDVLGESGADKNIVFGYIDLDNYYSLHFTTGYNGVILQKATNGKVSEISWANYPLKNGIWYHFQIQTVNNQIKVFIDNNLRIDYIDNEIDLIKGKFGIWITSGGATCPQSFWIDNLLVNAIE